MGQTDLTQIREIKTILNNFLVPREASKKFQSERWNSTRYQFINSDDKHKISNTTVLFLSSCFSAFSVESYGISVWYLV